MLHPEALVDQIRGPGDVALQAEEQDGIWTLAVSAGDTVGMLSTIAGLLSAYGFDILAADITTVHLPPNAPGPRRRAGRPPRRASPTPPRHRVLDVFSLRRRSPLASNIWEQFREELSHLTQLLVEGDQDRALDEIADRVAAALRTERPPDERLLPFAVTVTNEEGEPGTRLVIRSADVPGFLFAFSTALAGITVNIERAEIRTVGPQAHDTFWVTDLAGRRITTEDRVRELEVATALIKAFTHLLPRSPNPGQAIRQFTALVRQMLSRQDWMAGLGDLESPAVLETLANMMGVSRFLWEDFLRLQYENLFPVLLDSPGLDHTRTRDDLQSELRRLLDVASSHREREDQLNSFKDREMFRIDLRHITGRIPFPMFSQELTRLAEVSVEAAGAMAADHLRPRMGTPLVSGGGECPWCILALGKFGGVELGFGSDLELLFVYEGEGLTTGPSTVRTSEYFEEFVRTVRDTLHARQEGIFEIDLRLRPYGRAGTLATALGGLRDYFSGVGPAQQFERMALVKLRPVAGDGYIGQAVLKVRDAFVYSAAPLDRENLRHLRRRQASELVIPGVINAKYSPGGLVDIEYAVQASQIEAGRDDPTVRVTNTLEAIDRLQDHGVLSSRDATEWRDTYMFLRRLIDALRVVRGNARDLTVPDPGARSFGYLAQRLGYASPERLHQDIEQRMGYARTLWES